MAEQDEHPELSPEEESAALRNVPMLDYYEKTYGRSIQNDQKAVRVFRDYESQEKVRRLQHELLYIKENRVPDKTLHSVLGRKREAQYQGYNTWAGYMLLWISAKSRK